MNSPQGNSEPIEEQAEATGELIGNLTEKSNPTDSDAHQEHDRSNEGDDATHQKQNQNFRHLKHDQRREKMKHNEKHKKYKEAPMCKHCRKKHPSKKEDKNWEF